MPKTSHIKKRQFHKLQFLSVRSFGLLIRFLSLTSSKTYSLAKYTTKKYQQIVNTINTRLGGKSPKKHTKPVEQCIYVVPSTLNSWEFNETTIWVKKIIQVNKTLTLAGSPSFSEKKPQLRKKEQLFVCLKKCQGQSTFLFHLHLNTAKSKMQILKIEKNEFQKKIEMKYLNECYPKKVLTETTKI